MNRALTTFVVLGAASAAMAGMALVVPGLSIGNGAPTAAAPPTAVQRHWAFPIPLQGEPPASFSDVERSLQPAACGSCHPAQFALWKGSRHAAATGPGIHAQMLEMRRTNPLGIQDCSLCHFPMTEQHATLTGAPNPAYDEALYRSGLSCAACHVRDNTRYGPPRAGDAPAESAHDGFVAEEFFTKSEFCATCHQFPDDWPAINGKLLENTYAEWKASPYPAQGVECQTCHMPGRNHLWRGIHDKDTTLGGLTIDLSRDDDGFELSVENSGVGHMFPTYVTPSVIVELIQLDGDEQPIAETAEVHRIGRYLPIDLSVEEYDTRVAPGDVATFRYDQPFGSAATELLVTITVDPDEFYRRFYLNRLEGNLAGDVQSAYFQALAQTQQNVYVLWQERVKR